MQDEEAVILSAVRTPIGRYAGALKDMRPDDLAMVIPHQSNARILESARDRLGLPPVVLHDGEGIAREGLVAGVVVGRVAVVIQRIIVA